MSVRILHNITDNYCCFYCSTTMWAFGPIMYSLEEAEKFFNWLKVDPRSLPDNDLENKYCEFKCKEEVIGKTEAEDSHKDEFKQEAKQDMITERSLNDDKENKRTEAFDN